MIPIAIPPLRERKSDIPLLVNHYLKHFNEQKGKSIESISDAAMEILCNYQWPGNIRELANFMERMVVLSTDKSLTPRDLPEKVMSDVPKETWEPLVQAESQRDPGGVHPQVAQPCALHRHAGGRGQPEKDGRRV